MAQYCPGGGGRGNDECDTAQNIVIRYGAKALCYILLYTQVGLRSAAFSLMPLHAF